LSITSTNREDIGLLPLAGDGKPAPLVSTKFAELDAQISPDSAWFAYSSDESGRPEVYVQSLSDASKRTQVSTAGGARPRWRGDGKELFFFAGNKLHSAPVRTAARREADNPPDPFPPPAPP